MKKMLQTMLCWFPGNQTTQNSDNVAKLPNDPLNTGSTKLPTRHSFMRRLVLTCLLFSFTIAYAQTVTVNLTTGTSWTVPAGTYSITVQCWGAGGGGGRATSSGNCTGGGGGGAFAQINTISVNPGDVFAYSIGAGGVGNSTTTGNPGGDTWFGTVTTVLAKGGNGVAQDSRTGGTGGTAAASIGDTKYNGGNGGTGTTSGCCAASGGGGSGAGSSGNGNNGGNGDAGGFGCAATGGNGGNGGAAKTLNGGRGGDGDGWGSGNGNNGSNYGGGGGGAKQGCLVGSSNNGGNGAQGLVVITYTPCAFPNYAPVNLNAGNDVTICKGSSTALNATISIPSSTTILSQNFESGLGGWTTTNTSTGGIPANADWTIRTSSYTYSEILNSGSKFIMSNSDAAGGANSGTTTLVSPAFSAVGYTAMSLTFKQRYRYNGSESQNIDISINGGAWTNLYSNSASAGQTNFSTTYSLSLDAYAGLSNLKLRFRYVFSFDWYWCIDDILITGTIPTTTYAWLPTTGLSNPAISNPTATPTATTTYTVTASNGTCQSTDNVTVYVSGETTPSGTLATTTSSFMCAVNDAAWHYFRNSDGELIAAINGNGQTLGNVTLKVDVDANPNVHPNGGMGHAAMCNGTNELSVRRWYTVTTANTPTATTNLKFFFTPADYSNYTTVVDAVIASSAPYTACYGSTASVGDLRLSRNETNDVSTFAVSTTNLNGFAVTPANSVEYELALSPANMRLINGASPNIITAGPTTFRWHTDGGIGAPLPVELVSFTGYNQQDKNVLNWTTVSEQNSDKFEVEKSTDGISGWKYLGFQKATGGNVRMDYTFYDNQPVVGNNYYRLKIVDNDGTFTYSNTINIPVDVAMVNGIVKVFPSPTNGLVNIQLQSTKNVSLTLEISNLLGQKVVSRDITLQTGITLVNVDLSELSGGTYIVSYIDALGTRHQEKIIKQ